MTQQNSADSVLGMLKEENILSITKQEDGTFLVMDECDRFFRVELDADDVRALAKELLALVDGEIERKDTK